MQGIQLTTVGRRSLPALDGIRALAALSVLFYHSFELSSHRKVLLGVDITVPWYYAQTGVHLFFVLSGFLLFLPYARAMLHNRPLPQAKDFYWRRAVRILPTYWACLLILAALQWRSYLSPTGLANIATHLVLVHDDFRAFNRAIEGPFWTLAIEVQFYLLLPLLAAGIARIVGTTRSAARLVIGVLATLGGALGLRGLDALVQSHLSGMDGFAAAAGTVFVHVTMGMQGKFLGVFATGMLCAALYIAASEHRLASTRTLRWLGLGLLGVTLIWWVLLMPVAFERQLVAPPYDIIAQPGNWLAFFGPFLIGVGYGTLVLAVLWGGGALHGLFTLGLVRGIGLMSYSLYLWHGPIVWGTAVPSLRGMPDVARVALALGVGFVSYWLLERPTLRRNVAGAGGKARARGPSGQMEAAARMMRGRAADESVA